MSLDQRLRESSDEIRRAVTGRRGRALPTVVRDRRFASVELQINFIHDPLRMTFSLKEKSVFIIHL